MKASKTKIPIQTFFESKTIKGIPYKFDKIFIPFRIGPRWYEWTINLILN